MCGLRNLRYYFWLNKENKVQECDATKVYT